jgi:hypothetical protein
LRIGFQNARAPGVVAVTSESILNDAVSGASSS